MATFLFIGDDARTFPDSPLQAGRGPFEPGEHVEADENPDPRWFVEVTSSPVGEPYVNTSPQVGDE